MYEIHIIGVLEGLSGKMLEDIRAKDLLNLVKDIFIKI